MSANPVSRESTILLPRNCEITKGDRFVFVTLEIFVGPSLSRTNPVKANYATGVRLADTEVFEGRNHPERT
jgi:hypothetical protein